MDENALVDGAVMVNFGWEFFVLNRIIDLSICISEVNINENSLLPYLLLDAIYRVSHIRCSTARHERGCGASPLREQGNSIKVGCSRNPINCSEPFPCPLSGKMMLSLDV
jgi:hypothetical protein